MTDSLFLPSIHMILSNCIARRGTDRPVQAVELSKCRSYLPIVFNAPGIKTTHHKQDLVIFYEVKLATVRLFTSVEPNRYRISRRHTAATCTSMKTKVLMVFNCSCGESPILKIVLTPNATQE